MPTTEVDAELACHQIEDELSLASVPQADGACNCASGPRLRVRLRLFDQEQVRSAHPRVDELGDEHVGAVEPEVRAWVDADRAQLVRGPGLQMFHARGHRGGRALLEERVRLQ